MVTIRSHSTSGTHRCREPSWCTIMPGKALRGRLRRCTPRFLAGFTWPASCSNPLGPGVAELVAVLAHQLLVEVLAVEVEVLGRIELDHPRRHIDRYAPPRHAPDAPIVEPLGTLRLVARSVTQEVPFRHAQDIRRLRITQAAT